MTNHFNQNAQLLIFFLFATLTPRSYHHTLRQRHKSGYNYCLLSDCNEKTKKKHNFFGNLVPLALTPSKSSIFSSMLSRIISHESPHSLHHSQWPQKRSAHKSQSDSLSPKANNQVRVVANHAAPENNWQNPILLLFIFK